MLKATGFISMSVIESRVQPLDNASPDASQVGIKRNELWQDKDTRVCGRRNSTSTIFSVRTFVRIWRHLTHKVLTCSEFQMTPKHKPGEIGQSHRSQAQSSFWAASPSASTKAGAKDTEETAWSALGLNRLASIPSFFPTLPPSETCVIDLGVLLPYRFICFEETDVAEMDWSYISPLHFGALLIGVLPPRVTRWRIDCTHKTPPHAEEMSDYLSHVLSHENKHAVPLKWDLWCVRLGARVGWFPPPKMCFIWSLEEILKSVLLSSIQVCVFFWNQVYSSYVS